MMKNQCASLAWEQHEVMVLQGEHKCTELLAASTVCMMVHERSKQFAVKEFRRIFAVCLLPRNHCQAKQEDSLGVDSCVGNLGLH